MTAANCGDLATQPDIDGFLVRLGLESMVCAALACANTMQPIKAGLSMPAALLLLAAGVTAAPAPSHLSLVECLKLASLLHASANALFDACSPALARWAAPP